MCEMDTLKNICLMNGGVFFMCCKCLLNFATMITSGTFPHPTPNVTMALSMGTLVWVLPLKKLLPCTKNKFFP